MGVFFALVVVNPNFVNRRSWYMRKANIGIFYLIGWELGNKFYKDQITFTMLRMNDYFPIEIKRALQDQDFRHLALFNPEEEMKHGRVLFDAKTGKSLS